MHVDCFIRSYTKVSMTRTLSTKWESLCCKMHEEYFRFSHDNQPPIPSEDHVGRNGIDEKFAKESAFIIPYLHNLELRFIVHRKRILLYLNTVTTTCVDVAIRVNLHTVRIARVDIGKHTTVLEDLGLGIDIKPISVRRVT